MKLGAKIQPVTPGTYEEYDLDAPVKTRKRKVKFVKSYKYHEIGAFPKYDVNIVLTEDVYENIRRCFTNAVSKRIFGERKIGCLLSGGLGSSLVCGILAQELRKFDDSYPIITFSIGMGLESHDIIAARTVKLKGELISTQNFFQFSLIIL